MIGRFLRALFLKNWGLKLFSLFLAVLLWLLLVPEEKIFHERTLILPLDLYSIPGHLELVERDVSTVEVTIRAPKRLIDQIGPANVFAKLNLERASVIQEDYPLLPSIISAPAGAQVIKLSPNKARLKFEKSKEVELAVEPNLIGRLRRGLKLENAEVLPPRVSVRGPESKFRELDKVYTTPIDISNLTESTDVRADLILPRPEMRLSGQQTFVRVRLAIAEDHGDATDRRVPR